MRKKILSVLIIVAMCFSLNITGYASEEAPTFYINSELERYVGEEFTITYGMYNDTPLVDNFELLLYYNPEVLELIETSAYASDAGDQTYSFIGNTYSDRTALEEDNCLYILIKQIREEWAFEGSYGKRHLGSATFKVIGEGNADLHYVIKSNECSNGNKVEVDFNDLDSMKINENDSEINLSYENETLTIEGKGVIFGSLKDYDANNVLDEKYYKNVKILKVSEGIRILRISAWESLTDIYLPKSLSEFSTGLVSSQDVTIHSYAMSIGEYLASAYNKKFMMLDSHLPGDIDLNGNLNAEDALSVLKMAAKLDALYKWSADVNKDGCVNAEDALQILKSVAKIG